MQQFLSLLANTPTDIEGDINSFSIKTILVASLLLVVLLGGAAVVVNKKSLEKLKTPLFVLIAATIILPSLLLMGSTVYINTISESKGPVHWHSDIEFWVCGQEIELRDPFEFLSNKVGTATYHEHDDKRIHLEGVVIEKEYDASLVKFMDVTGGSISTDTLEIPTSEQIFENDVDGDQVSGDQDSLRQYVTNQDEDRYLMTVNNGDACGDSGSGEVQLFVYRYNQDNDTYAQEKITNFAGYTIGEDPNVPPSDCIIVEFDIQKDSTNRLCKQYGVRDSKRCTEFGVSEYNPDLCNAVEVKAESNNAEQSNSVDVDEYPVGACIDQGNGSCIIFNPLPEGESE